MGGAVILLLAGLPWVGGGWSPHFPTPLSHPWPGSSCFWSLDEHFFVLVPLHLWGDPRGEDMGGLVLFSSSPEG